MKTERSAVLLDPFPLWLDAVDDVLKRIEVTVVGRATEREPAMSLIEELQPEIFVVEPGLDGLSAIREAHERASGLKTIVLSSASDPAHIEAAFAVGAAAYVLKTAHQDDIGVAVRQSFERSVFVPLPVTPGGTSSSFSTSEEARAAASLTKRELQILRLVAEGHSNSQLARRLWVTEQTVKFHLSNVYRKLEVANRTEASRWAQTHGLLPPPVEQIAAQG